MSEQRHSALGIHALDGDEGGEHLKRRQVVRRAKILTAVVVVLLALGAARTVVSRISNARSLEAGTTERAQQYVKTTLPKPADAGPSSIIGGARSLGPPGCIQVGEEPESGDRFNRLEDQTCD